MRAVPLSTLIFAGVLISNSVTAEADPLAGPAPAAGAPIVRVQPRAQDYRPHSAANEAEQRRLSAFDAKQQELDAGLDNKLNICRC